MAWLRQEEHPEVGVMGMSLGGYTAALLATVESGLSFCVPVIPLASLADFAREQGQLSAAPELAAEEHAPPGTNLSGRQPTRPKVPDRAGSHDGGRRQGGPQSPRSVTPGSWPRISVRSRWPGMAVTCCSSAGMQLSAGWRRCCASCADGQFRPFSVGDTPKQSAALELEPTSDAPRARSPLGSPTESRLEEAPPCAATIGTRKSLRPWTRYRERRDARQAHHGRRRRDSTQHGARLG